MLFQVYNRTSSLLSKYYLIDMLKKSGLVNNNEVVLKESAFLLSLFHTKIGKNIVGVTMH